MPCGIRPVHGLARGTYDPAVICGKCNQHHDTVAEVRACYQLTAGLEVPTESEAHRAEPADLDQVTSSTLLRPTLTASARPQAAPTRLAKKTSPSRPELVCAECGLRRASVDPVSGRCTACTARGGAARTKQRPTTKPNFQAFVCLSCQRRFVVDIESGKVDCRRCGDSAQLRPECRSCKEPVERVHLGSWMCARCHEIRAAARSAAGAGETPTGYLRDRQSRARRVGRGD